MLGPTTQGSSARGCARPRRVATELAVNDWPQRSLASVGGLQKTLKDTLKLSFQLEMIDYHRPNPIDADLDAETFAKMQEDRGESLLSLMLNSILHEMSNPQAAAAGPGLAEILFALRSPGPGAAS